MFTSLIRPRQQMPGTLRGTVVMSALALAALLGGCVPMPYKPSAAVGHSQIPAVDAAATSVSSPCGCANNEPEVVGKSIQKAEPRIVLIDSAAFLHDALPNARTLADVMTAVQAGLPAPVAADFLLSVGRPINKKLHDTGAAAPFFFVPVIVGYEKTQSLETLSASFMDLQKPEAPEKLFVTSNYTEVAAGLVYGFMTMAMPEVAVRQALVRDVAQTLAKAQPEGPIRLVVLAQDWRPATR